jgi:predicted 3-demethylubiquinone-9 3-methyltransferase (glyoxalase superfamily)
MTKVATCLWFDGQAEEAARLYTSLVPDSRIDTVNRAAADNPSTQKGDVLTVEFTVGGHDLIALNGGPDFQFNEAISLSVLCEDQAEVDRLWNAILANGGTEEKCGWIRDRWGLSWQIVPNAMMRYLGGSDRAGAQRAMQAMMGMVKLDIEGLKRAYEGKSAA